MDSAKYIGMDVHKEAISNRSSKLFRQVAVRKPTRHRGRRYLGCFRPKGILSDEHIIGDDPAGFPSRTRFACNGCTRLQESRTNPF
jgi:hypothetical protein